MALQLTLAKKLINRTDANRFKPNEALTVEVTASTGWTDVSTIECIIKNASKAKQVIVTGNEFEIPADYVEPFGFELQFIGKTDGETVIKTYPCKFAAVIGSGGSGETLPELPADASSRNLVLEARQGDIDWEELTVLS